MEPDYWVPPTTGSLLDVGCNVGDLLCDFRDRYPDMELAGIDINHDAVEIAKQRVRRAEIHQGCGYELPFPDGRFECATCIEVIEHVRQDHRQLLLAEVRRVLAPAGRLILRCPHAGLFSSLDAQNFRYRAPRLYNMIVREGRRDTHYRQSSQEVVWHHHFTKKELLGIAGEGWEVETCEFGGLVLFPISDILRWPFYRLHRTDNPIVRALKRMATFEYGLNFGQSSYGILVVLKKA
jgi:SAM-dependent methyltransferase